MNVLYTMSVNNATKKPRCRFRLINDLVMLRKTSFVSSDGVLHEQRQMVHYDDGKQLSFRITSAEN